MTRVREDEAFEGSLKIMRLKGRRGLPKGREQSSSKDRITGEPGVT